MVTVSREVLLALAAAMSRTRISTSSRSAMSVRFTSRGSRRGTATDDGRRPA